MNALLGGILAIFALVLILKLVKNIIKSIAIFGVLIVVVLFYLGLGV